MEREEIYVEIVCVEDFFMKTFKYLETLDISFDKYKKIDIALQLFNKIGNFSYIKSVSISFVRELFETFEKSNY